MRRWISSAEVDVGRGILEVYALIDWHNVQRFISPAFHDFPARRLPRVILTLQECIAKILQRRDSSRTYRVTLRMYHGWHDGLEPTPMRRVFDGFSGDPTMARRFSQVSFVRGFQFGDRPSCGLDAGTLFSTFRQSGAKGGQKMVDTSICCDTLYLLVNGLADACIIVSDDDDFIPALVNARALRREVLLLREPGSDIAHVVGNELNHWIEHWSSL